MIGTNNAGSSWKYDRCYSAGLTSVFFKSSMTGYACGYYGTIFKTKKGGEPFGIKPISSLIPKSFSISQNFPNPFNPTTNIKFDVTSNVKSETSNVKLIIFDILGREVATLVNEKLSPGTYEVEFNGSNFASGVYFYKLTAGDYTETKKLVILK